MGNRGPDSDKENMTVTNFSQLCMTLMSTLYHIAYFFIYFRKGALHIVKIMHFGEIWTQIDDAT